MANTASRLSANGSLTINGTFDEVTGPISKNGLIGYWDVQYPYSSNTNYWFDQSGYNNHIQLLRGATQTTGNINFFVTNSSYGLVTVPQIAGASIITVECVVKASFATTGMLFGFNGYDLYANGGYFGYNTGVSDIFGFSPAQVSSLGLSGNYKHYVFVMTATGNITSLNEIWINGVKQTISQQLGTTTTAPGFNKSGSYYLVLNGWDTSGSYKLDSSFANFKIYNRQLTSKEIIQNYNVYAPRFGFTKIGTNPASTLIANNVSQTITQVISDEFNEVDYNPYNIGPTKNMFANSEDFTQQFAWATNSFTQQKNYAVAPDGKQTATLITGTGLYPVIYYIHPSRTNYQGLFFGEPGKYYTQSLFVKYVNQQYCVFVDEDFSGTGNTVEFDLINGTASGPYQQAVGSKIQKYDNGWWRISVNILFPFSKPNDSRGYYRWQPQWRMGRYDSTNYTGSQMLVWGMQLEEGNTASTYVATGFPKNILTFTNNFAQNNNWYVENCNVSNSAALDPNGNYKGQLLSSTITGGTNTGFVQESLYNLPLNTNYTYSVYLKQGSSPTTYLNFYNISPFSELGAIVTWPTVAGNTPTVSYYGGATRLDATVTRAANGWWRFSLSMNNGSSSGLVWRIYTTTNGTSNVPGYNVYIWGPQLEFGLTPTTYIENGGTFTNILPLANTNMIMKTTNTGNTFIKSTFDEVTGNLPVTNGLILYMDPMKLESYPESGTTAYDLSSSKNIISLSNVTYNSNGYFDYNGYNSWANTTYTQPIWQTSDNFTWNIWYRPTRNTTEIILGNRYSFNFTTDYLQFVKLTSSGWEYYNPAGQQGVNSYSPLNVWQNAALVKNGSTLTYYRNGVSIGTSTITSNMTVTNPFYIGGIGEYFKGSIGVVNVYNRALSLSEVQENFNGLRNRYGV